MSDIERIDQRLSAVERAVVDGDLELDELADLAALTEDLERLEERVEAHERRLAELEGSVDALDGFVGNVETVNEDVERQADAAIAAVDRLEYRIEELERALEAERSRDDPRENGAPSALESADVGEAAANAEGTAVIGTGDATGAVSEAGAGSESGSGSGFGPAFETGAGGTTTGATDGDIELELEGEAQETADEILDDADEAGDEESGGIGETIKRRLSGGDDSDEADGDDGDDADSTAEATAGDQELEVADEEESDGLFTSLRDRLP